jgi:hypothetical protein
MKKTQRDVDNNNCDYNNHDNGNEDDDNDDGGVIIASMITVCYPV